MDLDVTGVVVNYRTPELLDTALKSINKFYDIPIIVIDGSEVSYQTDLKNVSVIPLGYNIGHGLGMNMGIKLAKTKYVLTFDTDIEMKEPCLELMLEKMKEDTYAIGKMYYNDLSKFHKERPEHFDLENGVCPIVHPSFQIVQRSEYFKYAPYISDGAPTVLSYHDIMRHKKEEILIDFPVLDYVYHRNSGTRDLFKTQVQPDYNQPNHIHWQEKWKKYVEEHPID